MNIAVFLATEHAWAQLRYISNGFLRHGVFLSSKPFQINGLEFHWSCCVSLLFCVSSLAAEVSQPRKKTILTLKICSNILVNSEEKEEQEGSYCVVWGGWWWWWGLGTCCVDMVSRVVTPRETLAGTALGSSQKLTWQLDVFLQMSKPFSRIKAECLPKRLWQAYSRAHR